MSNIPPEELENHRKDFELSLVFNEFKLLSGKGGETVRNPDGTYANMFIEAAWRGYQMSISHAYGMLERYDPMRYISPGLLGAYKEASEYNYEGAGTPEEIELWCHSDIRAALTACKGTPV